MSEAKKPDWRSFYEAAFANAGYFRLEDAAAAGVSKQLLRKHLLAGRFIRAQRGVYRLAHLPAGEQDEFVELWLWSEGVGVFSHDTALSLHGLSDVLPSRIHMTVPKSWRRRAAVPSLLVLHFAEVPEGDRTWIGSIPVTSVARTIRDAVDDGIDPTLVSQAVHEATERKLIARSDVRGIVPPPRRRTRARRPDA